MKDSEYIWIEGKLIPYADARIHVLSHSLHYGTAVFEGMRAYETKHGKTAIFRSKEHFGRFFDGIRTMGFETHYSPSDLEGAAAECIRANRFRECYVRPIAYLDDSIRGLKIPKSPKANIAIATWLWGKYLGDEGQKKGIRLVTSTFRRAEIGSSFPHSKLSGQYITSVLARREASEQGMDEALLLDPEGFVAEGSGENFFLVKNGVITTPPVSYILPGITRATVIDLACDLGYKVSEEPIIRNQIYAADEAFFTGTAVEVTPIREVDRRPVGRGSPGPTTLAIQDHFFKTVKGEVPKFEKWLQWV